MYQVVVVEIEYLMVVELEGTVIRYSATRIIIVDILFYSEVTDVFKASYR